MQFQPSARIRILEKSPTKCGLSITILNSEAAIQGISFRKLHSLPFLLLRNDTICTTFLCILSEYTLHVEINHSLCQNSKLSNFTVMFFLFFQQWDGRAMGHLYSHVIFNRALFARQSCAKSKRIPLRLQRASYRAHYWVTTAQN